MRNEKDFRLSIVCDYKKAYAMLGAHSQVFLFLELQIFYSTWSMKQSTGIMHSKPYWDGMRHLINLLTLTLHSRIIFECDN